MSLETAETGQPTCPFDPPSVGTHSPFIHPFAFPRSPNLVGARTKYVCVYVCIHEEKGVVFLGDLEMENGRGKIKERIFSHPIGHSQVRRVLSAVFVQYEFRYIRVNSYIVYIQYHYMHPVAFVSFW